MDAVLSTRAKAAAALRTAAKICTFNESSTINVEDLLKIADELDGGRLPC